MLKFIAHDTVNDVAVLKVPNGYYVRYGLDTTPCHSIKKALTLFAECQAHALAAIGAQD